MTKWIKEDEDLRDIPIIAVTAFAMKGDEEKIRAGGCEGHGNDQRCHEGDSDTERRRPSHVGRLVRR